MKNPRDEFNVNNMRKERAPRYTTLGRKEPREASFDHVRLSCLQPSYLVNCHGKSTDVRATPGPGEYTQLTSFGAASGPTRKHYFDYDPAAVRAQSAPGGARRPSVQ